MTTSVQSRKKTIGKMKFSKKPFDEFLHYANENFFLLKLFQLKP